MPQHRSPLPWLAAVGMVLLVAASLIDPASYRRFSRSAYVALCTVMALVLVLGKCGWGNELLAYCSWLRMAPRIGLTVL